MDDPAGAVDDPPELGRSAAGSREGIVTVDGVGTGLFVAAATLATVFPDDFARPAAIVDLVLFAVGVGAFLWAYGVAVARSRTDTIGIAGLYFLAGDVAPCSTRTRLRLALAVQVVTALVSASIRVYTAVAFGVLVPMFGLGLMGLWGARHGRFPTRDTGDG